MESRGLSTLPIFISIILMLMAVMATTFLPGYVNPTAFDIFTTPSCGDTITDNVTFNSDLGPCAGNGLIIGADNITVDCAGHWINGSVFSNGIDLSGRSNVTIKNCFISNFSYGFYLSSARDSNITGNHIENTNYYGIEIVGLAVNNRISNNTITNTGLSGGFPSYGAIHLVGGNGAGRPAGGNTVSGNNITDVPGYGISTGSSAFGSGAPDNIFIDNNIRNASSGGIGIDTGPFHTSSCDGNTISGGEITECGSGIELNSDENNVRNVLIWNNSDGLYVSGSNNTLYNNNVTANEFSNITDSGADNRGCGNVGIVDPADSNITNTTQACKLYDNWTVAYDLSVSGTNAINIEGNDITLDCNGRTISSDSGTDEGVHNDGFDNISVKNCTITNFNTAIFFTNNADNGYISNNTAYNNTQYGIRLFNSSYNNLTFNNVTNNTEYGIVIMMDSRFNNVTLNDIDNNQNGFFITNSVNNTVTLNTINSSMYGVYAWSSSNNTFTSNSINNSYYDVLLDDGGYGIYIDSSSNSTFYNNTAYNNTLYAIYFVSSDYNNFTNGTMCYNGAALYNDTITNIIDNNTFCVDMLNAPINGSTIASLSSVSFNVSNPIYPNSANCSLIIDDSPLQQLSGVGNNDNSTIALATPYNIRGPHSWKIFCTDSGGSNTGNSSVQTFTISVAGPVCGNAVCETGETTANCPADCPAPIMPGGGLPPPTPPPEQPPAAPQPPPTAPETWPPEIQPPAPGEVITIPQTGTTILISGMLINGTPTDGTVAILLYPGASNTAIIHNISAIMPEKLTCGQIALAGHEINITADTINYCMNYRGKLGNVSESSLSVWKFSEGRWTQLPSDNVLHDTNIICGNVTSAMTPYMIAGFVPVIGITPELAMADIQNAQAVVLQAETEGKDVTLAKSLLEQAQAAFDGCDFAGAKQLADNAIAACQGLNVENIIWAFLIIAAAVAAYLSYKRLRKKVRPRPKRPSRIS